ncbi:hypothetical protein MMC25_006061 [Agyrium rufum]|nr:hypothetical protein [Agyrium rufum]
MSSRDMRRADLSVPYVEPPKEKSEGDFASTISSTLPMAAMFTRNKLLGWASVVLSLQTWLAETPEQQSAASTPGYLSVAMSFMSLVVTYLPLFLPPPQLRQPAAAGPS